MDDSLESMLLDWVFLSFVRDLIVDDELSFSSDMMMCY